MKTHTTLTLRTLIVHDMDATKYQMSKQEINVWMETLPEVTAEMLWLIDFFVTSIFEKNLICRQICQIQSECIFLMNAADHYQELAGSMVQLKNAVINCLEQILEKIGTHCDKYMSDEINMPAIHFRKERAGLEVQMNLLTADLNKKVIERKLQDSIVEFMTDLKERKQCSYRKMNYVKNLLHSLLEICNKGSKGGINVELSTHLFEINYNTAAYTKYLQQKITDELSEIYEVSEQFGRLFSYQRYFAAKAYRKSAGCYDPKRRRNKEVMIEFVNAEIKYLEKKENLNAVTGVVPKVSVGAERLPLLANGYKIKLSISVDALAYFIKLMVGAKVIEQGVRTQLMAAVAEVFQTPGTKGMGISAGSLGVKYKQVVQTTAVHVRAALMRMIKLIDEEFKKG